MAKSKGKDKPLEIRFLTDKQKRFCEEYLTDLNATGAALRAGYSEKTAYSIGWENLRKPEIKEVIEKRLKELSLSAGETTKLISDIARSSLNDYFVVKEVVRTPKVEKHLTEIIQELREEIEDADKFIIRGKIDDPKAIESHNSQQHSRKLEIVKLEIELERNPAASRIVPGKAEFVKVAELDIAKLVQDKEAGRIKSVSPTEFGAKVEMYAADAALRDVARMHGLFVDKVDHTTNGKDLNQPAPDLTGLTFEQIYALKYGNPPQPA